MVENKAGAASAIGTAYVGKAAPDGYTLLMTTNSAMVILPLTQPAGSLNYDRNDFSMIGLTGILPNLLIVSPKVPVNSVSELIAYAKARPGQLSFASSGNGTITHLIGELFKARTGIDVVHVPYRTGVQSAPDVMEGRVQYIFDNIIWSLPMIRAGQLKGLAITTSQRSTLAPDIPTVAESGVPGFEGITWLGLAAPAKTPEPVIARLATELKAVLADKETIAKLAATGAEPPAVTWAGRHARDARRGPRPLEGHPQRRKDQAAMNFHELCKTERPLILPGAFDAMSARLIKRAGFKAYFTGGFPTIGARWGLPDIGLVALGEISAAVTDIMAASDLPVMVDGDNGYGDVKNVVHVLHTYERLGVSAIMFEDQVAPKRCGHIAGKDVIPAAEMAAKITAASQSKINRDTFILARTDARDVHGLDEAFRRAELYLKNGADGIFIESPHDVAELEIIGKKFDVPQMANMLEGGRTPILTPKELADMGFEIAIYGISLLMHTVRTMQDVLGKLAQGDVSFIGKGVGFEEYKTIVGFQDWAAIEDRYLKPKS